MSADVCRALARTAQLLRMDVFPADPSQDSVIVDGLRATTVRLVADRRNLDSGAGQTAFVTTHNLIAMLGVQIEVDIPPVGLISPQPPVEGINLQDALRYYTDDLIPGGSSNPSTTPDLSLAFGDTTGRGVDFRISGDAYRARIAPAGDGHATRWRGEDVVGAMAAAAAGSVEAVRAAIPRIATMLGMPAPARSAWRTNPFRTVDLHLERFHLPPGADLGRVDIISGGAITNAALYMLLRCNLARAQLRVIEPDIIDLSNLNRYALARRSHVGQPKVRVLETYSSGGVSITGVKARLDELSAAAIGPFADRMLVGVDDIPSRWIAQRQMATGWLCVGASSHEYAVASAHPAGGPCAGCAHPRDEQITGTIPTISFVSFWAGFIQALKLVSASWPDRLGSSTGTHIWPLGLDNRRGLDHYTQAATQACPVRCGASQSLNLGRIR